jgi:hypothetical protein
MPHGYSGVEPDCGRQDEDRGIPMSTASVIDDAQHQMWDMSRAMMRLSWAMTVLGAQQAANMVTPSKMAKSGASMAAAFDAMSGAIEGQFGSGFQRAYRAGSAFALSPMEGLPSSELNRAMQSLVMQPIVFDSMKMMMPQLVASMSAFIPGRDVGLARQECEAKMEVMQLVQDVRKICPERSVHVPLAEIVAKAYALGSFPALWAVEGIGHDFVEARRHRGESLTDLLTSAEVADLPDGSLTMLHAGIGLGLAEIALDDLRPDSAPEKMDAALRKFLDDCMSSSRKGYVGCALESLGLVTRHFYGHSMVLAVDKRLEGIDEAMRGFFWHGVGRAVYFSPDNMLPGLSSPWPAVDMCDRLAPHDLARENMVAGVAWGMTMVNLKQPVVLEALLHKHGGFADGSAFSNGVASSIIMRKDTTPDEEHIAAFVKYEPATSDASLEALWDRVVRQPVRKALDEHYPAIKKQQRLGEIFRFQSLSELAS